MSSVRLESVRKVFGTTVAVDGVDLEIASGDLFFLLGPSGCGKTTLLRMIAGFATPTGGRISIGDRDVTNVPAEKRDTGMVFQSYALWPHMSVRENVAFGLKVRKLDRAKIKEEVDRALELVRMEQYESRKPNELSGGQQQRVALARALAFRPTILLLDEPASGLDPRARIEMMAILQELQRLGKTIIISSHILSELETLCNRVAIIEKGGLIYSGPVQGVQSQFSKKQAYRVAVAENTDRALELLRERTEVAEAELEESGDRIRVELADSQENASVIATIIVNGGLQLTALEPEEMNLEDVFLQVTRGETQ